MVWAPQGGCYPWLCRLSPVQLQRAGVTQNGILCKGAVPIPHTTVPSIAAFELQWWN